MVDYIVEVAGTTDGLSSLLVGYAGEEMFAPIYEWHVFCYTTFVDALEAVAADPAVAEVVAAEYDVRSAEEAVAWVVTVGRELFAKEHPSEATRQLVDLYKLLESSAADTPVLPYLGTGTALMSIASVFISGPTRVDATAPLVY